MFSLAGFHVFPFYEFCFYVMGYAAQSRTMPARASHDPHCLQRHVVCGFMSWEPQPRAACMPHGQHTTLTACNDIFWSILCPTQSFISSHLFCGCHDNQCRSGFATQPLVVHEELPDAVSPDLPVGLLLPLHQIHWNRQSRYDICRCCIQDKTPPQFLFL